MEERNNDFSAKSFVNNILKEGASVSCDETCEDFNNHYKLPPFYDEALYKKGQEFFYKHMRSFFFSKCLGLLIVLAVPSILKILIHTKQSSSELTAYKRYLATIFYMMVWYDSDFKPGSRLWKSIANVRNRHNSASKRSSVAKLHRISQKDMVLTQFGFMGLALSRQKLVGIHEATDEEWKAFLHVWRVIGYLLGIEDRFNLCGGTVDETREICNTLLDQVFQPYIEEKDKDFLEMSGYMLRGLWPVNPFLRYKTFLCYLYVIVQNNTNNNNIKLTPTYFELNYSQNLSLRFMLFVAWLMKYNWFRIFENYTIILTLWLMKVFPFLAFYQFGFSNAYVPIFVNDENKRE